ncbi:hypothetical protein GE09DRAFT_1064745 [Coniochaeta sp. 2T2.1]|nr:hypothetical protein GE09DRAFT_1064745 [Coniochaeta sp. 2T2.1]
MAWSTSIAWAVLLLSQSSLAASSQATGPIPDFASPQNGDRPKFRYWFPDARVSTDVIADDVRAIKDVGGGGLEFLSFYNYGQGPPLTNWSTYGFGTPAFKEVLRAALNASAEHGLLFDFALGPNQGQGVPSVPEAPGLAYELVYGVREIPAGQVFSGLVPPANPHFNYEPLTSFINPPQLWGENRLVSVMAADVVSSSGTGPGTTKVLEESSAIDLTDLTANGSLTWAPPAVDHFSAAGAKKMTNFWDQYLFDDDEIRELLKKAGKYSWEDSMEMMASLWWTPGFLDRFQKSRGYSAAKYLPVMFQASNSWNDYSPPYNTTYIFDIDATRTGWKYLQDYKAALNEGYKEYLQHFQDWASSLGLGHSVQPAYNLPLDMQADIPFAEAPELESLGFNEDLDLYRQFTGPAHLAGRNVISTEVGARRIGAYALTVPALVGLLQDSYAVGVNTMVIHGFPYSGDYVNTSWPGYTPFQYEFTEMWGPRMPAWMHFNDTMLYAARNTLVTKIGYTHEYVGPSNLASPNVTVSHDLLAADGPAYKALVLCSQTYITSAASADLLRFAKSGLPIIIAGSVPNTTFATDDQAAIAANMKTLVGLPSVQVISTSEFSPAYLSAKGILPRVSVSSVAGSNNGSLYTFWRHDESSGLDAIYVLNRGTLATFKLTFSVPTDTVPWELDAWTGTQTRLTVYETTSSSVTLNVALQQRQTKIFVFTRSSVGAAPSIHAVSHSNNIKSIRFTADNNLEAIIRNNQSSTITLSNGTSLTLLSPLLAPLLLWPFPIPWHPLNAWRTLPAVPSHPSLTSPMSSASQPHPTRSHYTCTTTLLNPSTTTFPTSPKSAQSASI